MGDDDKTSPGDVEGFDKRLQRTKASIQDRDQQTFHQGSAYSFGFRLATDLVAGVLAGFGIGWLLDYWLGTSPWLLLIFTPIGIAAGIANVVRAAKSIEAKRHLAHTSADGVPSVPDDKEE